MSRSAIAIRKIEGSPGQVYYPLQKITYTDFIPGENEIVITLAAASLNHRDLFIRQHLYPGTTFGVPLFSDGCGIVTATGSSREATALLHKRVILNPGDGWASAPEGPEDPEGYRILGGTRSNPRGTLAETICVKWDDVEEAPAHLDDIEAAAIPLTGLTAWRALSTKSKAAVPGHNVLITGIGGGVALMALQFGCALGVNVYVSSGSQDKIARAKDMGARGGVIYSNQGWEKELLSMLPPTRPLFDAIIDGAGGDIVTKGTRLLKPGGVIVSYGMTTGPTLSYSMGAVLKNIELHGSTMGSRKEFHDMVQFVKSGKIRPVISRVVEGIQDLEAIDGLFDHMKRGLQFGKMVVTIASSGEHKILTKRRSDGNL